MNIIEIYKKYQIMPQLQLHQLRVAGVASIILDHFPQDLDRDEIITACLLHDMGNIIKFDLNLFPESLKPRGYQYWEDVKHEYIQKYGNDSSKAAININKELHKSSSVLSLLKSIGFTKGDEIYKTTNFSKKITAYADQRVAPYGVVPMLERFQEGKERKGREKEMLLMVAKWQKIEEQIFFQCNLKPEEITDRKVNAKILKLKEFNIQTK